MHIPFTFRAIPPSLEVTIPPANLLTLSVAMAVRRAFNFPDRPDPQMNDIVRAFRLANGQRSYVEVGSRDKGNIAWLAAHVLADDATIIDLDIESFPENEARLRTYLKPNQTLHVLTGSCLDQAVLDRIAAILDGRGADLIFCDTLHEYQHTMSEFDAYYPLVRPGGHLFFHDCYFSGSAAIKGKEQGLGQIDRLTPVYSIFADEPTHRFLPRETNDAVWGGCGIVIGA